MASEADLRTVLDRAAEVIGSETAALDWVDKRSATLGGTPRELAQTREGAERVLIHLAGISRHRAG